MGFLLCDFSQLTRDRVWIEFRNVDYIADFVIPANDVATRFPQAYDRVLSESMAKEGMDTLEWISMGQRFSEIGLAEYAYHCYYMAHLLNPQYIKTNSDLQFDTNLPPNTNPREGANLDEILSNLLNDE